MKLLIVHLISEPAKYFQESLTKNISEEFNIENVSEKISPHLTFKAPFETNELSEIEKLLEDYVKNLGKLNYSMEGFGSFNKKVLFLDIVSSEEMEKIYIELNQKLKNFPPYHKLKPKFHSTIGRAKNPRQFYRIWDYLKEKPAPEFKLTFDNLAILEKVGDRWEVYKSFEIS